MEKIEMSNKAILFLGGLFPEHLEKNYNKWKSYNNSPDRHRKILYWI
ncbi:MAG: hypothetical protein RR063_10970 [Anaerovoracaceae bacterium]